MANLNPHSLSIFSKVFPSFIELGLGLETPENLPFMNPPWCSFTFKPAGFANSLKCSLWICIMVLIQNWKSWMTHLAAPAGLVQNITTVPEIMIQAVSSRFSKDGFPKNEPKAHNILKIILSLNNYYEFFWFFLFCLLCLVHFFFYFKTVAIYSRSRSGKLKAVPVRGTRGQYNATVFLLSLSCTVQKNHILGNHIWNVNIGYLHKC